MIRVIIEREVAEGLEGFYESAVANLLGVMSIPGIIHGQTLEPGVLTRDYASMTGIILILFLGMMLSRRRKASLNGHPYKAL